MDDPLICQFQLPTLNSCGYKDQWIQTKQLKINIYPYPLPLSGINMLFFKEKEVASLIFKAHTTPCR